MVRKLLLNLVLACMCLFLLHTLRLVMELQHSGGGVLSNLKEDFIMKDISFATSSSSSSLSVESKPITKDAKGHELSRSFLPIVEEVPANPNTCDSIFGFHEIVPLDSQPNDCIRHKEIGWKACNVGGVQFMTDLIDGPIGGEHIDEASGRAEDVELLSPQSGSLRLLHRTARFVMAGEEKWDRWIEASTEITGAQMSILRRDTIPTVLVFRPTYANPCFWVAAMYNLYVVIHKLQIRERPRIVFMDGHAWTHLDEVWTQLFDAVETLHIKQLDSHRLYQRVYMVNSVSAFHNVGMKAHIRSHVCDTQSSLHQFRNFVLNTYGLAFKDQSTANAGTSSSDKTVTFLVREDYKAHPRSNGRTDRTLANLTAAELTLQKEFDLQYHTHQTVRFESKTFREQLEVITQTDILIGVHGAGHIHVVFLPLHAKLIEYFPPGFSGRLRFYFLASCLGIDYTKREAQIAERFGDKITVHIHQGNDAAGPDNLGKFRKPEFPSTRVKWSKTKLRRRNGGRENLQDVVG